MGGGNVTLQIGEENLARVYNADSVTLTDGMIVYVYGNQGNTISVKRASATGETTSARVLGMVTESIPVGGRGFINTYGLVRDLDTSSYTGGTPLYLGTTLGSFTNVQPEAPNHICVIGYVSRSHASTGSIFIHISNGWEIDELHNVAISGVTNGDLLSYDSSDSIWKNTKTLKGSYTITGNTVVGGSLTATTVSATTYQNLPSDVVIINSTQIQSGFTGGVLFQSSASTVSQTTGFTWNNGRLGIGINSPVYDLDVNGSIYQRTGELLITSTGGVNKEGPFIASSGGDEVSSNRKIQIGILDNSTVPVGIDMFVTNNTFPPSYMNFRVNNSDLVTMSGSSVIISGNTFTSGMTATTISATSLSALTVTSPTVSATTVTSRTVSATTLSALTATSTTISATSVSAITFNLSGSQIESSWTSYTPVWTASGTNPVIGNGTIEGYYKLIGKTCFVRGNIAMGSTTTFGSGEWYVSMPFTAKHADAILLTATLLDNSSAWYNATMVGARAGFNNKAPMQYVNYTNGTASDVNATQPFTWANSDRFIWNGSYEIA